MFKHINLRRTFDPMLQINTTDKFISRYNITSWLVTFQKEAQDVPSWSEITLPGVSGTDSLNTDDV